MRLAPATVLVIVLAAWDVVAQAPLQPMAATAAVAHDPDDPALWINRVDPSRSLILGTDKMEGDGALYVFGLDGSLRQRIGPLDRPNNVDIEQDVLLGTRRADIAVVTERRQRRLRVFEIPRDGSPLRDLHPAGLAVLEGLQGESAEPMGVAIYKRPSDDAVFVIVSPKTGPSTDYLWQYRLRAAKDGRLEAVRVRRFGTFSRIGPAPDEIGEIEALVVDDELGHVYYSDERFAIRKYHVDPDVPGANEELAAFGLQAFDGDREGLAIYPTGPASGFIIASDQLKGSSRLRIYRREGTVRNPHEHVEIKSIMTASDATDGIEVTNQPLPAFPRGLLVMMNSRGRNFLLYSMDAILGR